MEKGGAKKDYLLPASVIVAAVLISGALIYLAGSSPKSGGSVSDSEELKKETSRDVVLGDPNAPVAVIIYGDYQCPFCARFFDTTEQSIRENYVKSGKAKMVFRNFQFLGAESELAAQAAECAKEQENFWAYHDAIYSAELRDGRENNGNLSESLFVQIAKDLKLDADKFTSCYGSGKYANVVREDTGNARTLGISSTPTTFINGQIVSGAQPFEYAGTDPRITPVKPIIENALKPSQQ